MRDASGNAIWQPTGEPSGSPIRFRDLVLLLVGGIVGGIVVGAIASLALYGFTKSKFVTGIIFGVSLYGSLILGYQWTARERD